MEFSVFHPIISFQNNVFVSWKHVRAGDISSKQNQSSK